MKDKTKEASHIPIKNQIVMEKADHQTPMTRVIVLEQQASLLAGSGEPIEPPVDVLRSDYGLPEELIWQ